MQQETNQLREQIARMNQVPPVAPQVPPVAAQVPVPEVQQEIPRDAEVLITPTGI
ncbi:hypothetical protein TIFTF001_023162 [Ficus carica]|uniref:Uncharacterized protein n=1 Tax=Ficus carica TaxID=3494 RepID=A0AA88AUC4_FICCA|nr:hypothetical protein TIFTF001_023162 [Ficus carica]